MIKKITSIIIMIVFVVPMLFPLSANAGNDNRTLQDLINELNAKEAEFEKVKNDQAVTEARITQIQANIRQISNDIVEIEAAVEKLGEEIVELNENIQLKDEEVKRIMNQYQLSNGNNSYVEYVMGAATVTDFIFRLSIVEQLTSYNQELIEDMNSMIEESEKKSVELEEEKVKVLAQKDKLASEQFQLGDKADELNDHSLTLAEEIADAKKTIDNYKRYFNCQPYQKLKDCATFPLDSSFARPVRSGYVTSEFGWRKHPVTGQLQSWHSGIDLGGNRIGTNLYAPAAGRVVYKGFTYCGGNYIIMQHNVNGKNYASRFFHINKIYVNVGDTVLKSTAIGAVGGGESYDRCSTGPHVHMEFASGIYGQDFYSFGRSGPMINPRSLVSFPSYGSWF